MIGIYKITSPTGRVYIGQSVDIDNRWNCYKSMYSKVKFQTRLYNSFNKHGVINHKFEVIEECEIDNLNFRERYWQEYYDVISKNGLNCRYTKTSDKSGRVSDSTLVKMSIAQSGEKHSRYGIKGKDNPLWGKKHSEESKKKIGDSLRGKKRSFQFRLNRTGVNNSNYGVAMSEEQKEKLRKKAIDRYKDIYNHPKNKMCIDLETGIYYNYAKEMANCLNIKYTTMKSKLNRNKVEKRFKYI